MSSKIFKIGLNLNLLSLQYLYTEIESCEESDEVLPLSLAQTKLDLLLEPSNLELLPNNLLAVDVENKTEFKETVPEIDTLEAHSELIKMREKLRVEKETEKDQVFFNSTDFVIFFFCLKLKYKIFFFFTAQSISS